MRPNLESLEDRLTPSVIPINVTDSGPGLDNPTTVTVTTLGTNVTLRDAINAANNTAGSDSYLITLQANTTYDLNVVDNFWYGPDGLPAIASNITIQGNGAVIQRDSASSTPNFRLFYVSGGFDGLLAGSLTLEDLTLQNGVAQGGNSFGGGGGLGAGGAIFNQGTLALTGVTLTNNQAVGGSTGVSADGLGGGGMGADAPVSGDGGGFGGALNGTFGGGGGAATSSGGGGGGGGFGSGDTGGNATMFAGGNGGGLGGFGGSGFTGSTNNAGDGGGGGSVNASTSSGGGGGAFGSGGFFGRGAGGGGGIGGGGGEGFFGGGGGGFGGGGGNGGDNTGIFGGGDGGFGGGGGGGFGGPGGLGGFGGGSGSGNSGSTTGVGGGGAGMGGGIFTMFGTLTLTNCTLNANTAQGGDGFNGGSGLGGAIFNLDGTLNLTFCTLDDNTVTGGINLGGSDGGAVYNLAFGNSIIDGSAQSATATITDSILSNSTGGNDLVNTEVDGTNTNTATVTLSGPNLVMSSTGTISGPPTVTSDPQLGTLQNNNGPTPTMAITSSSPAFQAGTPITGITTDQRNFTRPAMNPSLGAFDPQATPPATTTMASNITAPFSVSAQNVTLTADVTSDVGSVNEGTVTFTVKQGSTVIGAPTTSATVSSGAASVSYTLPGGTSAGNYTIDAVYNPSSSFETSSDNTHTLTVSVASTTTAASNVTAPFSTGAQNVTLTANVTSNAGAVNEGTVTFTIKQGSTTIGTAVMSNTVNSGSASVSYVLPAGTPVGNYTIDAVYNPGADFVTSSDSTHTLTVGKASTTIAAGNATTVFSTGAQNVILTAQVSSTAGSVNEGTVTFTIKQGSTIVGTSVTSTTVSNGFAAVSYSLPAGTTAGNYTIDAVYNPGPDFAASSDSTHTLLVNPSAVQLTTIKMAANLLNLTQTETLTAHVFGFAPGAASGKMSFTLNGRTLSATVDGNGDATASVVLPLITAQSPQAISVTYTGLGGPALSTTQTAHWQPLNALAISTATFAADGGQAIQTAIPGMLPITFIFNAQGLLTGIEIAGFGVDISYNSFNQLTQISVNGVVITQVFYTPQGQLVGVATRS